VEQSSDRTPGVRGLRQCRLVTGISRSRAPLLLAIGAPLAAASWMLLETDRKCNLSLSLPTGASGNPSRCDLAAPQSRPIAQLGAEEVEGRRSNCDEKSVTAEALPSTSEARAFDKAFFDERLEEIASTFVTENPDGQGLLNLLEDIARVAEVDQGSLVVDPEWSTVRGDLVIPGAAATLSFSVNNGAYQISHRQVSHSKEYLAREVILAFRDAPDQSGFSYGVQNHPDVERRPDRYLSSAEERRIGWTISVSSTGAVMTPISMSIDPSGGWRIGHAQDKQVQKTPWLSSPTLRENWLSLLRRHVPEGQSD
jgi:hypothetical protein